MIRAGTYRLVTLYAPSIEEVLFRLVPGYLFGHGWVTGTLSATLFAGMHNFTDGSFNTKVIPLPQFTAGLFWWYLMKERGFSHAVLAHFGNNMTAMIATHLKVFFQDSDQDQVKASWYEKKNQIDDLFDGGRLSVSGRTSLLRTQTSSLLKIVNTRLEETNNENLSELISNLYEAQSWLSQLTGGDLSEEDLKKLQTYSLKATLARYDIYRVATMNLNDLDFSKPKPALIEKNLRAVAEHLYESITDEQIEEAIYHYQRVPDAFDLAFISGSFISGRLPGLFEYRSYQE